MSLMMDDVLLYVAAQFLLVLSPGPVVAALVARVLSGGIRAAWPIAFAVFAGDMIWVSLALFGASAMIAANEIFLVFLRFGGAAYLIYLGINEILHAREKTVAADLKCAKGFWPNFMAGFVIIMTNPKAVLFYVLLVPQFFDVPSMTKPDYALVIFLSGFVPFLGNMIWALIAEFASRQFRSPTGRARLRVISGGSLILVGIFLLFVH